MVTLTTVFIAAAPLKNSHNRERTPLEPKYLALFAYLSLCGGAHFGFGQTDTLTFQWPNRPFTDTHNINGTFCEYRPTGTSPHFHNGADIGEPDDRPIYSCLDGIVHAIDAGAGSNSYVRIRTNVGGRWKHISYVHIQPNPSLAPGDLVGAGATVLGTIYPGQGHVHLTERELVSSEAASGVEINAIRAGGGLTPFFDTYTPVINRATLRFRQAGTTTVIPSTALYGKVDVIIKVDERTGTGNLTIPQLNNGPYMLGYRILSADSSLVVLNPPENGLRYKFDRKPFDSHVGRVFLESASSTTAHYYFVTNGSGASTINSTREVAINFFDTELLPEGNYVLQIFAEDTRGNKDSALFPISVTRKDLAPPAIPTLKSIIVDSVAGVSVAWYANAEADLRGYRLYYRTGETFQWKLAASESTLTRTSMSWSTPPPPRFLEPPDGPFIKLAFRLTAIDTVSPPNESSPSDVYVGAHPNWSLPIELPKTKVLVVDGFDRYGGSGSWQQPTHPFVKTHGDHIPFSSIISSCANEAVIDGSVNLTDFDVALWVLGDESTVDRTFTSQEQAKVKAFLEGGGKLFVSGSEIGWDLGRTHTRSEPGDRDFYENYLKARYIYDGAPNMNVATGVAGTLFESLSFNFGQTYSEDYPDDIDPINGSHVVHTYNTTRTDGTPRRAGVAYTGTFGASTRTGQLVYLAFPFETIGSEAQRQELMNRLFRYFNLITSVDHQQTTAAVPTEFSLSQNYPNPFNRATTIRFQIADFARLPDGQGFRNGQQSAIRLPQSKISLKVFDVLGREVATLLNEEKQPGVYSIYWDASNFSSGIYFARLHAGSFIQTRSLLLLK